MRTALRSGWGAIKAKNYLASYYDASLFPPPTFTKLISTTRSVVNAPPSKIAERPKTPVAKPDWNPPFFFSAWHARLNRKPFDETRHLPRQAIILFLGYCKSTGMSATIARTKAYLDELVGQGKCNQVNREALRWFFLTHRHE